MMRDLRFWSFLALVLTATACNGGFPSQGTPASDWTQSSTIPLSTRSGSFGEADKYLRKKLPGYTIIQDFSGSPDGSKPQTSLYSTKSAWPLIGTTVVGGAANDGTLYGLATGTGGSRTEQVLYSFGSSSGDGTDPVGFAIGYRKEPCCPVYVATESGGAGSNGAFIVLAEQSPYHDWGKTFTYSFLGTPDGAIPIGNPIADAEGNVYGTTESGGTYGLGTVYRMQPRRTLYGESILHSFDSSDGEDPYGGLIMDRKDNLYGTTYVGGSAGEGTVFKLTPSKKGGYTESVLHSFLGPPYDGSRLTAGPCGGPADSIYGTTEEGGTNNIGTVYKLTPTSGKAYKETIVWNFGSVPGDGAYPVGGLIVNRKGVIYGTTLEGGAGGSSGDGTIFSLTPSTGTGKYKETVYSFTGSNGAYPYAAPTVDANNYMYFTTSAGGTKGDGTVIVSNAPVAGLWTSSNWSGCT